MYLYEGSQESELQQYKISEKLWSSISAAFERAAKYIHAKGGYKAEYLTDKEVKPLIDKTYEAFSEAVDYGLRDNEIPTAMRMYLQDNVFVFSGFKAHTELRQASALLRDASGQIKPFNRFLSDIQKIDKTYNKTYLQAEYNFAVASSQAAARWQEIAADGDDFLLQYRTAKDERVREQHRILDGITLPPSDKFWDDFFPPNGWNCRCYAVQVNPKRYPESNSEEAIQRGRAATFQPNSKGQNKAQIFRFNPGKDKKIFPPKHPYYPKNCGDCQFRKFSANEDSTSCGVCRFIRRMQLERAKNSFTREFWGRHLTIENSRFFSNKFILTNTSIRNFRSHAERIEELEALIFATEHPEALEFARVEEIDREEHSDANADGKVNRNILNYTKYYINVNGQDYTLSFELHSKGFEQPYGVRRGRHLNR